MSDENKVIGFNPIRAAIENAPAATAGDEGGDDDAGAQGDGGGGYTGGGDRLPLGNDGIPEDCPIRALGRGADGKIFFYMNDLNQLTTLKASDHTHQFFAAMAGRDIGYLSRVWPQKKLVTTKDKDGNKVESWIVTGFHSGLIRDVLMQAASVHGVWDPSDKLRGRGCWRDDDGRLIVHLGNRLLRTVDAGEGEASIEVHKPGELDGYVYSASAPLMPPAEDINEAADKALIADLVAVLKTWNWKRPDIDPALALGFIPSAIYSGALDIRPLIWVTGDAATGKSTLHELFKLLLGDWLLATGDTTAAGIYQKVKNDSLPVALDELEAEADNSRQESLIKLARNAFSGTVFYRGGSDHNGVQFQARSAFLFSSILIPPLTGADRSRMAILDLAALPPETKAIALDARHWRKVGGAMLRRLIVHWPRFRQVLALYKQALAGSGHDARGAAQLGTLLAAREVLLFDDLPDQDTLADWADKLKPVKGEARESDAAQCLNHLAQSTPDHWRGGSRSSVAELVDKFMGHEHGAMDQNEALAALATGGCSVTVDRKTGGWFLAVANTHQGTKLLFRDTRWEGKAGLEGVWKQALMRIDGARAGNVRIAKKMTRCVLVPWQVIVTSEAEAAEEAETEETV